MSLNKSPTNQFTNNQLSVIFLANYMSILCQEMTDDEDNYSSAGALILKRACRLTMTTIKCIENGT